MDLELVRHALDNVLHQKTRSRLTILGIVIGIAAIVALMSIGASLQGAIDAQFKLLGKDTIYVSPSQETGQTAMYARLTQKDLQIIAQEKGVQDTVAFYETAGIAKKDNEEKGIFLIGIDPQYWQLLVDMGYAKLGNGRKLEAQDEYAIVLPENFMNDAYSRPLGLREKLTINGKSFRIVGILAKTETGMASAGIIQYGFVPEKAVRHLFETDEPTEAVLKVRNGFDPAQVAKRLDDRFVREYGEKRLMINTPEGLSQQFGSILAAVQLFLAAIAALSLLVGGLGIANTTLMNVLERYQEIGTMKAVGATNNTVLSIFLFEAILMAAIGGILGVLLGLGGSAVVSLLATNAGFPLPMIFDPATLLFAIGFAMAIGMISGLIPARQAAMLDPVTCLRYE